MLRAKIDMASPNVLMRDPTMYRIIAPCTITAPGDKWCIYPMYDFQHPLQDAIEGITHSLCSLEYEIHRPLYDWVVAQARLYRAAAAADRVCAPEYRATRSCPSAICAVWWKTACCRRLG